MRIERGRYAIYATGRGLFTYSEILRTPGPKHRTVATRNGTVMRALIVETSISRYGAQQIVDERNNQGAMT